MIKKIELNTVSFIYAIQFFLYPLNSKCQVCDNTECLTYYHTKKISSVNKSSFPPNRKEPFLYVIMPNNKKRAMHFFIKKAVLSCIS